MEVTEGHIIHSACTVYTGLFGHDRVSAVHF